jgi:hypothetical protein
MKLFDLLLIRLLGVLLCLWLCYHMRPQGLVQLVTPTQTVTKTIVRNGLPDWEGLRAIRP